VQNALVPVAPIRQEAAQTAVDAYAAGRPNADFMAQLIAAAIKAPQTRQRRRATPDEAIALYRATEHLPAAPSHGFSRSF
jgi:hypothetical protein